MDLRRLRYFVAVADAGHITRAAELLGMQQPPLSQQIKALEDELGLTLFHRHPKGVALTDAGRELKAEAVRLLADATGVAQRMAAFARGERGTLAIGFTSSSALHAFTPQLLRVCRQRHPEVRLRVSEDNAADLTAAVRDARVHCGLLRVPVARPPGLAFEELFQEPSVLAIPVDHRLAGPSDVPVDLKSLRGESLILVRRPGAPGLYANLLAACARRKVPVTLAAEVDRMMTNLNLVAAGVGLSLVPSSMIGIHPQAIVYRPLAGSLGLGAPLTLVYRRDDLEGPTATFVALAREIGQAHRVPRA
jgi:DNA-binding transcriptional LysR family regulator